MSAKLSRSKPIQDKFSLQQPGQINVAGEVFFMNLPGENQTDITSSLYDDSIKGDLAFQMLYMGGLPIEEGGKNFTKQQQTDLRRIFRAVFGPRQRILPTASQVKTLGRMAFGKKGQVMPSKPPVFQLPCDDKDRDLMIKALQIRRVKLIEQIQNYDKLKISDIHARYMRDHLKKLSDLLDNQIIEAKKTKRGCRYTGVIDPNASNPMPLSDERMHRLLEIFAFLLAQGKDPLRALSGRLPAPSTIIPSMANADAPDIYEYEESFGKERDGKTPDYTPTLIKIRKVLKEDEGLGRVVINEELKKTVEDAERELFPTDPNRSSGTFTERKQRILNYLKEKQQEINEATANKIKCDTTIAGLRIEVDKSKAALDKCLAEKKTCEDKLGPIQTEIDGYKAKILELEKAKEASDKATEAEKNDTLRKHKNRITELNKEKEAFKEDLKTAVEKVTGLNKELAAAKAKIQALEAGSAGAGSSSGAAAAAISRPEDVSKIASLEGRIAALELELADARKAAAASGSAEPAECAAKQREIDALSGQLTAARLINETAQRTTSTLREKINELLRNAGFTAGDQVITAEDLPATVESKINALSAKYSGLAAAAEAAAAGPAEPVGQDVMICLLNMIYNFFKNIFTKDNPDKGMKAKYESLFLKIQAKSQLGSFPTDATILSIFNIVLQNLKEVGSAEGTPLQGVTVATKSDYQTQFDALVRLYKTAPILQENELEVAGLLLGYILGDTSKNFNHFYMTRDGLLIVRETKPTELESLSFAACLMFLLGLTKKILTENTGTLLRLKCNIVESL